MNYIDAILNPNSIGRTLPYKLTHPESKHPTRDRSTDAGFDLYLREVTYTRSGVTNHHLGVAVNIPEGFVGLLRPRSSIRNYSYSVASSCIIDAGYIGELVLPLMEQDTKGLNGAWGPFLYEVGDKCAQLVILPLPSFELQQVESLGETNRGDNGFGSSGK